MAAKPRGRRKAPIPPNAPQHEEIRFAKKAQWAITAGGIGILFIIYQSAKSPKPLSSPGMLIALSAMLVTALLCFYLIWSQQQHLAATRKKLDPKDTDAFYRDIEYPLIYLFAMIACSTLFLFLLHRGSL